MNDKISVGLIGNPNCGKSTLFNLLTGLTQRVGNWSGVTVEKKSGSFQFGQQTFEVVDLPGVYSLTFDGPAEHQDESIDEKIARDFLREGQVDIILNIVDASNLERNLYLTAQLAEMGLPMVLALNMMDVAKKKGLTIDVQRLSEQLKRPVIPLVSSKKTGLDVLKKCLSEVPFQVQSSASFCIEYDKQVEELIQKVMRVSSTAFDQQAGISRAQALMLLEHDYASHLIIGQQASQSVQALVAESDIDVDILIADARYGFANQVIGKSVVENSTFKKTLTSVIDKIVIHRFLGIPFFLAVMYLMFMLTIQVGGAFIDFFEIVSGAIFIDGMRELLNGLNMPEWLTVAVSDGIGGGIQVVSTFIPIIAFLFFFLAILEDSGYMVRAAFVIDRLMQVVGLPSKSLVPMIVGFGCNVPAVAATRTLDNHQDRLLTIAMTPFMSCGARLPVYVLFGAAFFPSQAQNIVFFLYLVGIVAALLTGLLLKKIFLKGTSSRSVIELPDYHLPTLSGVLRTMWVRLKSFIFLAGRVIVPMVFVINILSTINTKGQYDPDQIDESILSEIGRAITPVFTPFGLQEDNWPATVGIFTGVLAKEVVVGTLDAAYGLLAKQEAEASSVEDELAGEGSSFSLKTSLSEGLATIPANFKDVLASWLDPLGIYIGDIQEFVSEEFEVNNLVFGAMVERFDGTGGAMAYLLFILLYFPCVTVVASIYQESSLRWAVFVASWATFLAYAVATIFYQVYTFSSHPISSGLWVMGMLGGILLWLYLLHRIGSSRYAVKGDA